MTKNQTHKYGTNNDIAQNHKDDAQSASNNLKSALVKAQPTFMLLLVFALIIMAGLWRLLDVWLIIFAAILVAIFILSVAQVCTKIPFVGQYFAKLPRIFQVIGVIFGLFGLFIGSSVMFGHELVLQLDQMHDYMPAAIAKLKSYTQTMPMVQQWLDDKHVFETLQDAPMEAILAQLSQGFSMTPGLIGELLGGITTFLAILLVGIFFAISPQVYTRSFVRLIAPTYRPRGAYLLSRSYTALQRWLIGQLVVMAFVGVCTAVGLYFMDVPFALALGFIAFILDFIPVLGPWLAAIPLLLTVMVFSPDMLWWAVALVVIVQQLESYVISPMVQHKLVDLPPVALLFSQLVMGSLTGFLGIALATPLMVLVIVWVQILYVKFVLGDYQITIIGQDDNELQHDPYRALKPEDVYADSIKVNPDALNMDLLHDEKIKRARDDAKNSLVRALNDEVVMAGESINSAPNVFNDTGRSHDIHHHVNDNHVDDNYKNNHDVHGNTSDHSGKSS